MAVTDTSVETSKDWTPDERQQIEAGSIDLDIFADRLFEQIEAAPPLLNKEEMYELEDAIQQDQIRRAAFAVGSLSGGELCKKISEDRDFATVVGGIYSELGAAIERYNQLSELFSSLQSRLMVALCCREDMESVVAEGKATLFE